MDGQVGNVSCAELQMDCLDSSLIPVTLLLVLLCYPAFGKENKYCKPLKQIKGDVKVNVLYSRENHLK